MVDNTDTTREPPLGVLDVVRDREDDDADDAVVVNTPPVTADEWVVHRHDGVTTVADDNPEYDADAEVVVVAFRDELAEARPGFVETTEALPLADTGGLSTYAFPPGRLRRVASICPEDGGHEDSNDTQDETEAHTPEGKPPSTVPPEERISEGMRCLRERLAESGDVRVGEVDGEAVLVVPKLGEEHTIFPDGSVSDGPLEDRIADLAAEYLEGNE
jgi:hypothetical protein